MAGRPRKNDVPEDQATEIIEAYVVDKVPLTKLMRHFNVTQYVMTRFLRDHDVTIRPKGRVPKHNQGDKDVTEVE